MTSESSPVERPSPSARIDDVSSLSRGDRIEAIGPDRVRCHGRVEEIAPEVGVLWIKEEPLDTRRMLDTSDYSIRVICG
ncbi:hypothetical protein [Crystallibacter degradans]|uniref:hypothetical protein n=1 Tax=Crystallibacter degradans TaxID=2726743 RepID=UPI001473984C|nr:hypothetical protein [Arthrobacter sp. SF27]NMR32522.1 hypothetical protein [Arthrobacter sp. SF27]